MTTDDAELERLRADVEAASSLARESELSAGALRGQLAEMSVQLARARQDQDTMLRRREMSAAAYVADLGRELWNEVLRPRLGRVARLVGVRRSA